MDDLRLLEAAKSGQTDLVLQLLEEEGQSLQGQKDKDGKTALHLASVNGHIETVTALTLNGADVNAQDLTGHTALQRSSAEGHVEVTKHLISRGAAIDHQDEVHGNTALHEASWKGFSRTVNLLCSNKSNYYLRNRGGFSPLHLCCQNGHNETCRALLRAGCKPNIKNNYGDTPLHTAARYGHAGVARILISAKCNPNLQNKNGDSPLHIAAAMGRKKLTKIILESSPDLLLLNQQKETALEIAKRKGHQDIQEVIKNPPPKLSDADRIRSVEIVDGVEVINIDEERPKVTKKPQKKKKSSGNPNKVNWSPYGCHYFPDPAEFPDPDPATLPEEPLHSGEQYFLDLGGNIKKGPASNSYTCYCAPLLQRVEKKMDKNKKEMFKHLDQSHGKLTERINHLEKRTKVQVANLSNHMKETFAQERVECHDRMERRAIRDRIAAERYQTMRDVMLRGDLSAWLEKRVQELETNQALRNGEDAAFMRTILRSSKKRKKSFWTELQSGTLRRAASDDNIHESLETTEHPRHEDEERPELRVSDHPHSPPPEMPQIRVRRNSAGDGQLCDFGDFQARELTRPEELELNAKSYDIISYSTTSEAQSSSTYKGAIRWEQNNNNNPKQPPPIPIKKYHHDEGIIYQNFNIQDQTPDSIQRPVPIAAVNNPTVQTFTFDHQTYMHPALRPGGPPILPPKQHQPPPYRPAPQPLFPSNGNPETFMLADPSLLPGSKPSGSDGGGSHDSHNDSGYCAIRSGLIATGSGGPSPSLSGSQGRPDSRGALEMHLMERNTSSIIAPRIRQLQQQLSMAKMGNEVEDDQEPPRGSLV